MSSIAASREIKLDILDAIRPYYQSILGGKMDPEEAVKRMQEQAEKKIREMQG